MWNDEVIKKATADQRLNVSHIALIFAIIILCRGKSGIKPIQTSRRVLMEKSHIGSIPTYHKCLKELVLYEYIKYNPSYHPSLGSRIELLV